MSIAAVPTLSVRTWLTDPSQAIAYILRFFLTSPKSLTDTFYPFSISMIDILSQNSQNIDNLCHLATQELTTVFNNIYGLNSTSVSVTPTTTDGANYNLTIEIIVFYNGSSYTVSNKITLDSNNNLSFNF